jgi:hypothetical protein
MSEIIAGESTVTIAEMRSGGRGATGWRRAAGLWRRGCAPRWLAAVIMSGAGLTVALWNRLGRGGNRSGDESAEN